MHGMDPDKGVDINYCLCDETITLSILSTGVDYASSCAYTSISGSAGIATITTDTNIWTTNCVACTYIGVAATETCTTVAGCTVTPTPTVAAWVGNLSTVDIGNAEDGSNGTDLATDMFKKLRAFCSGSSCTSGHAEMDKVEAVLGDGEEPLKPAMYLQDAQ